MKGRLASMARLARRRAGAASIEAGLIGALLFTLAVGLFDFAFSLSATIGLESAAYHVAIEANSAGHEDGPALLQAAQTATFWFAQDCIQADNVQAVRTVTLFETASEVSIERVDVTCNWGFFSLALENFLPDGLGMRSRALVASFDMDGG